MPKAFDKKKLKRLFVPKEKTKNGQVTIIGGSSLFHGAPILSLKVASRICDVVFFASSEPSVGRVAELAKSHLMSFIWIPWDDVDAYIKKSDAVLIGPGFMRFGSERAPDERRNYKYSKEGKQSRDITKKLLKKFPEKRWVIDAGSLQVMDPAWIPKGAILTPNKKELEILFGVKEQEGEAEGVVSKMAKKYSCVINSKDWINIVCSPEKCVEIPGGNPGLSKGGVGDVLAGLTVALYTKNDAFLAACASSCITKASADELYRKVGTNYNSDDLADKIPEVFNSLRQEYH